MKHSHALIVIAVGWLLLNPTTSRATVIAAMNTKHLAARADRVFVGQVVGVKSRWNKSHRRIITEATVVVQRNVIGAKIGERLVIRRLGGTVGTLGMRVAGVAVLQRGERVLLFTELRAGHRYVVGMQQGVYRMQQVKGRTLVYRRLSGLALVDPSQTGVKLAPAPSAPTRVSLDRFVSEIKQTAAACKKAPESCRLRLKRR